jgi:cytochrome c oxidase cbb3-type subunit 3
MFRVHWYYLLIGLAFVISCSPGGDDPTPSAAPEDVHAESWRESRLLAGQEIYQDVCASCHARGEGDAPAVGDRDAWSGRSDLWTAVLAGHASSGYFDMPEKGGHGELTDDEVAAATEYILMKTFPEKPRD